MSVAQGAPRIGEGDGGDGTGTAIGVRASATRAGRFFLGRECGIVEAGAVRRRDGEGAKLHDRGQSINRGIEAGGGECVCRAPLRPPISQRREQREEELGVNVAKEGVYLHGLK